MLYDIAVIGAGVVGSMIARNLAKYNLSVIVLEKENDVAMGSSKANSGIVHAGYDALPGTLKALLNVRGCKMLPKIAEELNVPYKKNGSLTVAFSAEEMTAVYELYTRGKMNGVENLSVLDSASLSRMEPYLNSAAAGALYAPDAGVICPYSLTVAALGNAMDNGVELRRNFNVTSLCDRSSFFEIRSGNEMIEASFVINTAGLFSDAVASLAGDRFFGIHPRRGEYFLLDREYGNLVSHTVFQVPGKMGKGVLVAPTAHGNLLIGPSAEDIEDKSDKATTGSGLSRVWEAAVKSVPSLPPGGVITSFSGLRAVGNTGDFIICQSRLHPRMIHCAGIESPGLASSPAIAEYVESMLKEIGVLTHRRKSFSPYRARVGGLRTLGEEERRRMIENNPSYGKIVCRCEEISEGEILDAIHKNPCAVDVDGIKRRTRCGMGRCQSGFCLPSTAELISRELNVPMEKVTKKGSGSELLAKKIK